MPSYVPRRGIFSYSSPSIAINRTLDAVFQEYFTVFVLLVHSLIRHPPAANFKIFRRRYPLVEKV
jgi:hypothetical protein